jgi:lipoprotein-anchoring transpeptidase ErfK/SrfK
MALILACFPGSMFGLAAKSMRIQSLTTCHSLTTIFSKLTHRLARALTATAAAGFWLMPQASAQAREFVAVSEPFPAGTIVIKQSERKLYFTTGSGTAVRYPIAIGKAGKLWRGEAYVQGKFIAPAWEAPDDVRRDHPEFTHVIPGGSPHNPMGAAAITLSLPEVAIHGTTAKMRRSVGTAASYGCIRMYNEDIVDLYRRVGIGTPVVAIP